MAAFLVTFEINDAARNLRFREHLQSFGSYCPMNNSSWIVISNLTAKDLIGQLQAHIEILIDKLFVLRAGSEAAWSVTYPKPWDDWLEKNLG